MRRAPSFALLCAVPFVVASAGFAQNPSEVQDDTAQAAPVSSRLGVRKATSPASNFPEGQPGSVDWPSSAPLRSEPALSAESAQDELGEADLPDGVQLATTDPIRAEGRAPTVFEGTPADLSLIEETFNSGDEIARRPSPQPFSSPTLRQFGYDFFKPLARGFPPVTDVPVPPEYVLGPGDLIVLNLWGSIEGTYELEVSRSGEVVLPKVGTVRVWGTPFGSLEELIRAHIAKVFKDFELDVNLGKLRLIKVYVVGEVGAPGGYSISALSTVINALSVAGGPTRKGTLRNIQVTREGQIVATLDLYDFFLHANKSEDMRLQEGDTVLVPLIGKVAGAAGTVKRPAIYELKDEKSLKDLLGLAGGIEPTGYLQRVQVVRVEAHRRVIVSDFDLNTQLSQEERTAAIRIQDKDVVKVFPIDRALKRYVRLDGYVLRPGDYAWRPGMRLSDLLLEENLLPEYYAEAGEITRLYPPDFHPEVIFFNLSRAVAGDPQHDVELEEFDTVRVFSRWEMEEMPRVKVSGEVLRPGTYRLFDNMTVRDLVMKAGNLRPTAHRRAAEVVRLKHTGAAREADVLVVNLEDALEGKPEANLLLAPDDELVVREAPLVPPDVYTVKVSGEVRRPGEYRLHPGMTVRELLWEAGDPLPLRAYLQNAELNRIRIERGTVTSFSIAIDLEEALRGNLQHDIELAPYDELIVRRIPNWVEETERYVTLIGELMFPGTYPIYKGERLSSAIERAGGFTEKAYLRGAKFTRKSVQVDQQRRLDEVIQRTEADIANKQAELASVASSEEELQATAAALEGLQRSLELLKRSKPEGRVVIRLTTLKEFRGTHSDVQLLGGDTLTIPQASNAVTVMGDVYNATTLISMPGGTVSYYLARAGGPTRTANENDIYVIRADGSIISRQQPYIDGKADNWFARAGFTDRFMQMELESGDTLVVPRKLERIAWMREIKDITQIISQVALTAGVLIAAGL